MHSPNSKLLFSRGWSCSDFLASASAVGEVSCGSGVGSQPSASGLNTSVGSSMLMRLVSFLPRWWLSFRYEFNMVPLS